MDHGSSGTARRKFILRWEGRNLNRLPDVLEQQISSGRFHTETVGACNIGNEGPGFTTLPPGSNALLSPFVKQFRLSH